MTLIFTDRLADVSGISSHRASNGRKIRFLVLESDDGRS
jgi:hypothetical protein